METLSDSEIYKLRRSPFPLVVEWVVLVVPVLLIFLLLNLATHFFVDLSIGVPVNFYLALGAALFATILEILRRYFNDLYVFGHKRIIHFHGCLSLRLSKTSIYYSDIREISVRQGILGRIARYGTLTFATPATVDAEITFKDIPLPRKIARRVQALISRTRRNSNTESSGTAPSSCVLRPDGDLSPAGFSTKI